MWMLFSYWLLVWNMNFIFPYLGNNNPNWLIFFRRGWNPQPVYGNWCIFRMWSIIVIMWYMMFFHFFCGMSILCVSVALQFSYCFLEGVLCMRQLMPFYVSWLNVSTVSGMRNAIATPIYLTSVETATFATSRWQSEMFYRVWQEMG